MTKRNPNNSYRQQIVDTFERSVGLVTADA